MSGATGESRCAGIALAVVLWELGEVEDGLVAVCECDDDAGPATDGSQVGVKGGQEQVVRLLYAADGSLGEGACLDDTGYSTTSGTQAQIWSCTGNANQSWTLP
jgi:hypothetical protein